MKQSKFVTVLMLGLALTFVAAGCKRNPKNVTPLNNPVAHNPGDMGPGSSIPGGPGGTGNGTEIGSTPIAQPNPGDFSTFTANSEIFKDYTVHFAYDSSAIRESEKSKLAAVADHMKANPSNALRVEGHCDERGTDEYNRALGDRRALALREELIRLGVDGSKVMTVSFGRQRPVDTSGTEEGRSKNRRGEFILLTPP